ncbi:MULTISPECIES: HlyD family efflux transporter periplasmic adaptor subunit [Paraburkholderia]|uniref:Multidrug export protein EmrA n=1 Tax=Paraburkholderia aspalathi TaxID=1324617 RepID=A0ABM8RDZ5_9BURK|nr:MULTISPECIES: HlyD family efflux transporter periplasmic adaptor subunit [Paraburkholderia]MBK3819348.1 HlyD family efflux transporter periplasmic adaptor subunit [Paraburkholderia aspalathi]MBK3831113.1 HlyD family efflux transporter periplasmic adaptor subunit [Paraburkholderia aspalathi]MBK3860818.1 HlyD family efflux transporter periplasmic adaptor subunit [Paraburkholderia aspalathi]MCX4158474.1 HlyD family efflux transporter periplasmic adaptor subunit [Paraburkholderia aspalathi]MDN7
MSDTITTNRETADADQPQQVRAPAKRKLLLALLAATVVLAGAGYGAYYITNGQYHQSTDDAYVNGNLVQLTPQVSGTVVAVNADDTQIVKQGAPVVTLDNADAKVALSNAEATLGQTVRQVSGLYVNNDFYAATVAQRQSDLARAEDDLKRRQAVAETGAVSGEDIAHARDAVSSAQAALDAARQQAAANHALTDRTSVELHPNVQAAASKVRDAYLSYARNTLPAPVTGYVARRSVQVGQRVAPGTPLMAIVPLDGVWVDANFKEGQLKHMRIGQPVTLTADVYGSSVKYHGHVVGFSAGTGAAFAVLPAQNATGNWIKVVQRLPARIQLDQNELNAHPLRIGLSMQVDVETRDESGTQLGAAINTTYRTDVFAQYGADADAEIARIIAQNMPSARAVAASATPKNAARIAG